MGPAEKLYRSIIDRTETVAAGLRRDMHIGDLGDGSGTQECVGFGFWYDPQGTDDEEPCWCLHQVYRIDGVTVGITAKLDFDPDLDLADALSLAMGVPDGD